MLSLLVYISVLFYPINKNDKQSTVHIKTGVRNRLWIDDIKGRILTQDPKTIQPKIVIVNLL